MPAVAVAHADPQLPRLAYTIAEAAAALGVRHVTVRRAIHEGRLRAAREKWLWLIPATELTRYLESAIVADPAPRRRAPRADAPRGGRPRKATSKAAARPSVATA